MVIVAKRIFGSFLITNTIQNSVQINETSDRRFVRNSGDPLSNIAYDFLALCDLVVEKLESTEVKNFPLSSIEKPTVQEVHGPGHPLLDRLNLTDPYS